MKTKHISTLEKTDIILGLIYRSWKMNRPFLKLSIREYREKADINYAFINPIEIETILDMLERDKYIKIKNERGVIDYLITVEGTLFYEQGGYSAHYKNRNKLEQLQENQFKQNKLITRLTIVVAIGTLISALKDIFDIAGNTKTLFNVQAVTALFIFIAGALATICLILVATVLKNNIKKE